MVVDIIRNIFWLARLSLGDKMIVVCGCDCQLDPKEAYEKGEDLLTDKFERACIDCDRIIHPSEFLEEPEEDYEIENA